MKQQITMSGKNLGEVLSELIVEHGITIDKLSELTNIPKRYLSAIVENDEKNMPASPYIKGYIAKISSSLEIDPCPLLEVYKKSIAKTSLKADSLPKNRFAITTEKPKKIILTSLAFIVAIIGFLFIGRNYFFADFIGTPSIEVNLPDGENFLETNNQFFIIEGRVNPQDSVRIRNELISVNTDGSFSKEALLDPGINVFEIKVQRFLGRETSITRTIIYTPEKLNETNNININNGEEIF